MMQLRVAHISVRAEGRWRGILVAAGIPAKALSGKDVPCPMCGGKDRFQYKGDNPQYGNGGYICRRCGSGDGFELIKKFCGIDFREAARMVGHHLGDAPPPPKRTRGPDTTALRDDMRRTWTSARPVPSLGVVDTYLLGRGVVLFDYPSCIREAAKLRHKAGGDHPAMLALVRAADGTAVNVHRTYLSDNGDKANVEPVRMLMRGSVPRGSAVRLAAHGDVLGIAEGIETAWSASQLFDVPVWAALNAGRLEWWQPPRGVRTVWIFGDNDENGRGQLATDKLAWRLDALGLAVERRIPAKAGTDWNDVLRGTP